MRRHHIHPSTPVRPALLVPALLPVILLAGCRGSDADAGRNEAAETPSAMLAPTGSDTAEPPVVPSDSPTIRPDSMMTVVWFEQIEALWMAQRYGEALPALKDYRRVAPYGRNEVVDYMIGTSACRVPGEEVLGQRMLQWVLAHYSLNAESREMVIAEQRRCPPSVRMMPVSLSLVGVGPASTSGTRGKLYYYLNRGEDIPLANEPVEIHREIPLEELHARLFRPEQADSAVALVQGLLGERYRVAAYGPFVMASRNHNSAQIERMAGGLARYMNFYADEYGMPRPPELITIYLTVEAGELLDVAERVHGIGISRNSLGYSFRDDLSMVGIVPGDGFGTLAHELFHLMVRRDFGDIPPWLDEGIAALYEVSETRPTGRIVGIRNWRGRVLRELWSMRPPVAALVEADWQAFEAQEGDGDPSRQAANHATARYLMMYLQEQGTLAAVYKAFRAREALATSADPLPGALGVLEGAVGRPVDQLDRDFAAWFEAMPDP